MTAALRAKLSGARRELESIAHRVEAQPLQPGEASELVVSLGELREKLDAIAASAMASGAGQFSAHAPIYQPRPTVQRDPPLRHVAPDPVPK